MKKQILSLVASLGMWCEVMAQNQIETYSVYDVNHQDGVTVADATRVVSRAIDQIQNDPQVVDAATLNALLQELKSEIQQVNTRLSAIEERLGIETPIIPESPLDPFNGHDYVDLGIKDEQGHTIYWATCNLGAESPEDYGLYFAWGETVGYTQDVTDGHLFDREHYSWCDGMFSFTKYCANSNDGTVDGKVKLEPEDDAAHVYWGGAWRMPTKAEQDQLRECTWTMSTLNGVKGCKVTGPNGQYIFLPFAGYREWRDDNLLSAADEYGYYWSSSLYSNNSYQAYDIIFGGNNLYVDYGFFNRECGAPIRPVLIVGE